MIGENGIVLSIPQLRLSLNLMDYTTWDDLPLADTGEPVEQRMLNAFLGLIQAGWWIPTSEGYEADPDFKKTIDMIGVAKQAYSLLDEGKIWAFLYESVEGVVAIMPDWGHWEYCKILNFKLDTAERVAGMFIEARNTLKLQKRDPYPQEFEQYDLEQLVFFFGAGMEEAE